MKARFTDVNSVELNIAKETDETIKYNLSFITVSIETKYGKYKIVIEDPSYMKIEKFT